MIIIILIILILFAGSTSSIVTRLVVGEENADRHWLLSGYSLLISVLIVFLLSLIGTFTIISRLEDSYVQPEKTPKYELIQGPVYKQVK